MKNLKNRIFGDIKILKQLGSGSFGVTYLGLNVEEDIQCAVKFQLKSVLSPQLYFQYGIYQYLAQKNQNKNIIGFPTVYQFFENEDYNILVMELLGQNIETHFSKIIKEQQRFTKGLQYSLQMLQRIKNLHDSHILHRDIKPQNFVFGINQNQMTIYLVDFGLSKKFMKRGIHIPMKQKQNKPFMGTQRFASLNAHNGKQQSRRDDLQSFLYTILFLIKGSLPWQTIKNKNILKKREQIKKMKQNIIEDDYLDYYPQQFQQLFSYIRKLGFQEAPNYQYIQQKLKEAILIQKKVIDKIPNSFQQYGINSNFSQISLQLQLKNHQFKQIKQIEVEKHQNLIKNQNKNKADEKNKKMKGLRILRIKKQFLQGQASEQQDNNDDIIDNYYYQRKKSSQTKVKQQNDNL